MSLLKKFPSYRYVLEAAGTAFARFPLVIVCAFLGTIVTVNLVDVENVIDEHLQQRLMLVAALGFPLFISLSVLSEKQKWGRGLWILVQAVGAALLVAYYFTLPGEVFDSLMHPIRFLLLNIGLHFLVAFIPYVGKDQSEGFWQYNVSLFLRFLTTVLYSAVLYIGLTIALAAADHLFGFEVREIRYFQLWVIVVGIFSVWVFLAGIPTGLTSLNHPREYPKGLKIFTQFILLPLVALYFVILIAYEAKIIIEWNWPKGWVSQLVLWYSVVGILSSLLLHPLRKQAENRWVHVFTTWFFRALIPLVVMLFLAIAQRISDYGITENRYFVLIMAIGLAIVMLYFIVSRKKDIRIIPIVICILAFVSAFGPVSAFTVSLKSQQARLDGMLSDAGLLVDGALRQTPEPPPFETRKEMSSIVDYINEWHGLRPFAVWLPDTVVARLDTLNHRIRQGNITHELKFDYVGPWHTVETGEYFTLMATPEHSLPISGYDWLITLGSDYFADSGAVFESSDMTCSVELSTAAEVLIRFDDTNDTLRLVLAEIVDSLIIGDRYPTLPGDQLTFELASDEHEGKIFITSISGYSGKPDGLEISRLEAVLVVRRR